MAPPPYRRDPLTDSMPAYSAHSIKDSASYAGGSLRDPLSPAHSVASAATDDTFSSFHRPPSRGKTVSHPVAMSDRQLYKLASETANKIPWDTIARHTQTEAGRWKWQGNSHDFSVYERQTSEGYAVFATGVVPCTVAELVNEINATTGQQHLQKMSAFHGGQFKGGTHVYTVDLDGERMRGVAQPSDAHGAMITNVMVKTATFTRTNWLHRHEEWCYLATVRRHPSGERFEKHMSSLAPKDLVVGKSDSRTKFLHDVISGVLFQPEPSESATYNATTQGKPVQLTRVHFYAEYTPQASFLRVPFTRSLASDKAIKQRLLMMAQGSERFTKLVRRRRLGVQVLVDQLRILPPTNTSCFCCSTSLLLAKLCRLCGQGVCSTCSQKHEREVQVLGGTRTRLEVVRVCDRCMSRVDKANYAHLTDRSLMGPVVYPNAKDDKPANETLKELLQQALVNAPSHEKQASVMSVIKCVLDDANEKQQQQPMAGKAKYPPAALLTETCSVDDYMMALEALDVQQVQHQQAEISANSGRAYTVDPSNADESMHFPMPANEAERLRAIQTTNAQGIGHSDELNIICDLAAKELDSFASLVTIVTESEQQVIGANLATLENARFPRSDAFCSHTIMDDKPLIVPHPEADVRFHQIGPVQNMAARYYCGFPIVAEDNKTVIGALCCVDTKTHDMTESQYAALSKLAQTASKVVRLQGQQRRQSSAAHQSVQYTQL